MATFVLQTAEGDMLCVTKTSKRQCQLNFSSCSDLNGPWCCDTVMGVPCSARGFAVMLDETGDLKKVFFIVEAIGFDLCS